MFFRPVLQDIALVSREGRTKPILADSRGDGDPETAAVLIIDGIAQWSVYVVVRKGETYRRCQGSSFN